MTITRRSYLKGINATEDEIKELILISLDTIRRYEETVAKWDNKETMDELVVLSLDAIEKYEADTGTVVF